MIGLDTYQLLAAAGVAALISSQMPFISLGTICCRFLAQCFRRTANIIYTFLSFTSCSLVWKLSKVEPATEVDAVKALARALTAQQKKVVKLESAAKKTERDANTLKSKISILKREKRELASLLEAKMNNTDEIKSKLKDLEEQYRMKVLEISELKDSLSRFKGNENGGLTVTNKVSNFDEDVPQCDPTKSNDQVVIKRLREELAEARNENEVLRANEKLNANKIVILKEMKAALETQVKLLEAN